MRSVTPLYVIPPCPLPPSFQPPQLAQAEDAVLFFVFSGPHPRHMEVPRLGVELERRLPAYTTATAMWDPSHVCTLHHSLRQREILNPLSEARDRTCILRVTSQIRFS